MSNVELSVDADLESYFDTIPKAPLLEQVSEKISDGTLLDLIQRFLDQAILEDMRQWTPTAGVPQASVLSPLLSNLYLHPFDDIVSQAGHKIVRYCDSDSRKPFKPLKTKDLFFTLSQTQV